MCKSHYFLHGFLYLMFTNHFLCGFLDVGEAGNCMFSWITRRIRKTIRAKIDLLPHQNAQHAAHAFSAFGNPADPAASRCANALVGHDLAQETLRGHKQALWSLGPWGRNGPAPRADNLLHGKGAGGRARMLCQQRFLRSKYSYESDHLNIKIYIPIILIIHID